MRGSSVLLVLLMALVLAGPMPVSARAENSGSVAVTVVACPDGIDPRTAPDSCTDTQNLPRDARLSYAGADGQVDMWVKDLDTASVDRDTWLVEQVPAGVPIELSGVEPTEFTYFHVDGAAPAQDYGWASSFMLEPGEERELTVYVWNDADGAIEPESNTLIVRTFACPEGVDFEVDSSTCTTPIAAPDGLMVGGASRGMDAIPGTIAAYEVEDEPGMYVVEHLPTYTMVSVTFSEAHDTGYGAPVVVGTDAV